MARAAQNLPGPQPDLGRRTAGPRQESGLVETVPPVVPASLNHGESGRQVVAI